MLTIENLKAFGANTEEGVVRCVNNESFYLTMVGKAISDANFEKLEQAIQTNDLDAGFEAAHALKGILGNLSLTPILEPVQEITELLRARSEADYDALLQEILTKKSELESL